MIPQFCDWPVFVQRASTRTTNSTFKQFGLIGSRLTFVSTNCAFVLSKQFLYANFWKRAKVVDVFIVACEGDSMVVNEIVLFPSQMLRMVKKWSLTKTQQQWSLTKTRQQWSLTKTQQQWSLTKTPKKPSMSKRAVKMESGRCTERRVLRPSLLLSAPSTGRWCLAKEGKQRHV